MRTYAVLLFFALPLLAKSDVAVQAWARATTPGASSAAIYGLFENRGSDERRVAAIRFSGAKLAMIHRTLEDKGMVRMVHGDIFVLPGGRKVLKPGGLHVMLMGISSPLLQGCRYEFQILWRNGVSTSHEFLTGGYGQMIFPADPKALGSDTAGRPCP
jgi:periplasmic copper chaperone A